MTRTTKVLLAIIGILFVTIEYLGWASIEGYIV